MPQGNREDDHDEVEFSVTNLRPPRPRSGLWRRVRLDTRRWRWVAVAISLAVLLAVLLSSVPATRQFFGRLPTTFTSPTATPDIQVISQISGGPLIIEDPTPTPLPGVSGIPQLGHAPASCPQEAAKLQSVGPGFGQAIGGPSIWVGGFTSAYPTLSLRNEGQQTNTPFGWPLHYTQYGWPAPIILILAPSMKVPVILYGSDPRNNQPLWFGLTSADSGAPPADIGTSLTLDPNVPVVPPSGTDATGSFWFGYVFLPHAGCYSLAARPLSDTSDGMWTASFSAGR